MFYSQNILCRRGRFGIIWIEATGVRKLTRRQIMGVNIKRTCRDILEKIPTRVPRVPREGELPQTLSLYLAAQLMFGTVRVYNRQQEYLLADATSFKNRIRLQLSSAVGENDLPSVAKLDQITMPDPVEMAGPKQIGFDPYFGLLKDIDLENVQLTAMQGMDEGEEEVSEQGQTTPLLLPGKVFRPEFGTPHTVSSIEEITMKDISQESGLFETEIPGEKDLPPLEEEDLQVLMEDYSPEKIYPTEETPGAILPPREERQPRERGKRRDVAESTYVLPKRLFREEDLSMVLPPAEATRRRRRRRRYLRVDETTQLSKEQLQKNMETGYTTCRAFVLPMPKLSTPTMLFKRPGSDALWKEKRLLKLWKVNCKEGMSETESDKEQPIWSVPELVTRRARTEELLEGLHRLSIEIVPRIVPFEEIRDRRPSFDIPMSRTMTPTETTRDEGREESFAAFRAAGAPEVLSPRLDTSLTGIARLRSGQQIARTGKIEDMDMLPEEMEPGFHSPPSAQTSVESEHASDEEPVKQKILRICHEVSEKKQCTTFRNVCKTSNTRKQAAHHFSELLELVKMKKVHVKQTEPYGPIHMSTHREYLP